MIMMMIIIIIIIIIIITGRADNVLRGVRRGPE